MFFVHDLILFFHGENYLSSHPEFSSVRIDDIFTVHSDEAAAVTLREYPCEIIKRTRGEITRVDTLAGDATVFFMLVGSWF